MVAGVDLVTGRVAWQHRNGTVRDLSPLPLPFKLGVPNLGGPIAIARVSVEAALSFGVGRGWNPAGASRHSRPRFRPLSRSSAACKSSGIDHG